jgi:alpha-galactosidase
MIRKAIDNCGRPIVLSISPSGNNVQDAGFLRDNVNMWRTTDDFWDNWRALKHEFDVCAKWASYGGPGNYPDADMLPLGRIGIRAERGKPRPSGFTKDEQYTLMTLFSIFRSPLMFGGNLPDNDEFTLSLLTNKAVLEVDQHSVNNKQLFRRGDIIAWSADKPGSDGKYIALFNASDSEGPVEITVTFSELGIDGVHKVTDLWSGNKLGSFTGSFSMKIRPHGAGLFLIR